MSDRPLALEWLNPHFAVGIADSRLLECIQSSHQLVEVLDTPAFGKLFRLDGRCMTSEKDEFFYHETLVHPAATAHSDPRRALVIGGGDGGSAEELLKYAAMEHVAVAELDRTVVDVAKRHLQAVHRGAFDDARLALHIGDGLQYAEQAAARGERFDLIVLDLTDPDSPAQALYSPAFFALARRLLNPGGTLTLHLGSPIHQAAQVGMLMDRLRTAFAVVRPMTLCIPLYGSLWAMAVASDALDPARMEPAAVARRLGQRRIGNLQYYGAPMHAALFALPPFLQSLLAGKPA
jgi:spermidine synthase